VPAEGRNEKDETALLFAMRAMHSKLRGRVAGKPVVVPAEPARALLEARADVETVDPQTQETLLMQAAKEGDLMACRLLLEYRADPLRQNLQGQNAINLCSNRPEVALLLRSSLVSSRGEAEAAAEETEPAPAPTLQTPTPKDSINEPKQIMTISIGDQEMTSVDGMVNQVDLEEEYDTDWENPDTTMSLQKSYDEDWDALDGRQVGVSCG